MFLEIVTPEKKVFEGEVNVATFPGSDGSFQILNDHAPLISALQSGNIVYKSNAGEQAIGIKGGIVEVLNNRIIVLAEGLAEAS